MRRHREWPLLQAWRDHAELPSLVQSRFLTAVRLDTILHRAQPMTLLTLRFDQERNGCSIPGVLVDELSLRTGYADTFIWPEAIARRCGDAQLQNIEVRLRPWLRARLLGHERSVTHEEILATDASALRYRQAQEREWFGAVALESMARTIAIAEYVARFAPGSRLCVEATSLNIAALLAPVALASAAGPTTCWTQDDVDAWFGTVQSQDRCSAHTMRLAIGSATWRSSIDTILMHDARWVNPDREIPEQSPSLRPVPFDLSLTLPKSDIGSAPAVMASEPVFTKVLPTLPGADGTSSGRLLFALPPGSYARGGADLDEAEALAALLRREGFAVTLCDDLETVEIYAWDLVHAFGSRRADALLTFFQRCEERQIPFLYTPFFEDASHDARWGTLASRALYDNCDDDVHLERALRRLMERSVEVDGVTATRRHDDQHDQARRLLLRDAQAIFIQSTAEGEAVRRFSGRRQRMVEIPPVLFACEHFEKIAHLVPDGPFVLIDAPYEPSQNLVCALRVLTQLELPVVVVGVPSDQGLYRQLRALAPGAALLTRVTREQCQAIYARATLYLDPAWIGDGFTRCAHALAYGSAVVVAKTRLIPQRYLDIVKRFDPASPVELRDALVDAWQEVGDRSQKTPHRIDPPEQILYAIAQQYDQAARLTHV